MSATRTTKLICTIGPASAGRVGELVDAGMDIAPVNFAAAQAAVRILESAERWRDSPEGVAAGRHVLRRLA